MKKILLKGFTVLEMLIIIFLIIALSYFLYTIYSSSDRLVDEKIHSMIFYEQQAYLYNTILNDIDSSFLGHKILSKKVQIKIFEKKHFSFLIQKENPISKVHPSETGLYYVDYHFTGRDLVRKLYPVELMKPLKDRWNYESLSLQRFFSPHSNHFPITDFAFNQKKDFIEMFVSYKEKDQEICFLHRWRIPFS